MDSSVTSTPRDIPSFWDYRLILPFKSKTCRAAYILDHKYLKGLQTPRYFICWQDVWDSDLPEDARTKLINESTYVYQFPFRK